MITRDLVTDLHELLASFPAIALLGPRQIGKTPIAKALAHSSSTPSQYLDLEDENDY